MGIQPGPKPQTSQEIGANRASLGSGGAWLTAAQIEEAGVGGRFEPGSMPPLRRTQQRACASFEKNDTFVVQAALCCFRCFSIRPFATLAHAARGRAREASGCCGNDHALSSLTMHSASSAQVICCLSLTSCLCAHRLVPVP